MIARRIRQCRPIFTCEKMMLESTSVYEFTRTSWDSTLLRTSAPDTIHPADTIELIAMPVRPGSPKTNFAGGYCRTRVPIGQFLSYRLKIGETEATSLLASKYASSVPTSRQYRASCWFSSTKL